MKVLKTLLVLLILTSPFFAGCKAGNAETMTSPEGYDLNKPFVIKLPQELDEISGLSFYPKDKSVFAIVDEKGVLYKISLQEEPTIQQWKFYKKGDFEDLVVADSTFYGLISTGSIVRFNFNGKDTTNVQTFPLNLDGTNEFEILYNDPVTNKLVLICKECEADKKSYTTVFSFDRNNNQYDSSTYTIDVTTIAKELGENKIKFKPSAAALNPVTGELFIISSVNKALVIADREGHTKKVFKLHPGMFKQPEGLCFTPEGDLIISNESAGAGAANILIYKYKNK
jgi:uncharacterized protein YjiK